MAAHLEGLDVSMVEVSGYRLQVAEAGSGPALLLLNGSGANLEVLAPLARLLAGSRRVITFDQPGMGASPPRYPTPTIPELAELADALLNRLGAETADVLGYSFGGAVAQQLAFIDPERVRSLVLVASLYGVGSVPPDPFALAASFAHVLRVPGLSMNTAAWAFGGVTGRDARAYEDFARRTLDAQPDPASYAGQGVAISAWSSLPWLWTLRTPTLVLTGDEDRTVLPLHAYLLASWIPRATFEVLPGAGHLLVLDQAADVAARIETFLRG